MRVNALPENPAVEHEVLPPKMTSMVPPQTSRAIPGVPTQAIQDAMNAIESAFGSNWLKTRQHPVALLWQRTDILATQQLFWFGSSLVRLQAIDQSWVKHHISKIKNATPAERRGSMFEILGLDLFTHGNARVVPAAKANPVIDADIIINGHNVRISFKNFSVSQYQDDFQSESLKARDVFLKTRQGQQTPFVGVMATLTSYPTQAEWTILRKALSRKSILASPIGTSLNAGPWELLVTGPPTSNVLSVDDKSYVFSIVAPHHPNEARNVIGKIGKACSDFAKKMRQRGPNSTNALFLRLADYADINLYTAWANQYAQNAKGGLVDQILLYQPAIAQNPNLNTISLTHYITQAVVNRTNAPPINMTAIIGQIQNSPTHLALVANSGAVQIPLHGHHLYQSGEVYHALAIPTSASTSSTVNAPFYQHGIISHIVVGSGKQRVNITAKTRPSSDLTIFS